MALQRWATFDCYGTLVDWQQGMDRAIESVAPGHSRELLRTYYQVEKDVEAERPFRSYREVLAESLRRAASQHGVSLLAGGEHVLAETLPDWPIFPDVGPALGALRAAGWKLAILSNVDRDLIAGTLQRLPASFDAVVTAQDVSSYKPGHTHFIYFRSRWGVPSEAQVHVAQSWYHDIHPAHELGLRSVWINRHAERRAPTLAAAELPDLAELPTTLERIAGSPA